MSTVALTAVQGSPVVSRATAEKLGQVTRVIIDVGSRRVVGVVVNHGRNAQLVGWDAINGIGPDAVVVRSEDDLGELDENVAVDLLGHLVLTDLGSSGGKVIDMLFDDRTGAVAEVVSEQESVSADRLLGLGSYALVIASA